MVAALVLTLIEQGCINCDGDGSAMLNMIESGIEGMSDM